MLEAYKGALEKAGFTIENLRNRIKELEVENEKLKQQKRCETCMWRNCLGSEMEPCTNCIRRECFDIKDHYEPKETA